MKKRQVKGKNSMMLIYVLLAAIVFMVAGYAIFTQNVSVTGTATADANYALAWQNPTITTNVGGTATAIPTLSANNTILTINPVLEYPGAYVEVTASVKNIGGLPAKITNVVPTNPIGTDIVVTYTPTFAVDQTLAAGASTSVVIRVQYATASTNQEPISETFGMVVTYTQNT